MNNCGSEYVTPNRAHYDDHSPPDHRRPHPHYDDHSPPDHRRPHPHYDDQNPPDHRYYNVEPKVNLRRSGSGARKKLNFYQEPPMFGQPAAGQASSFRPWKEAEKSKISPYLKLNGKFHSMSNQSPKVKQIHFFYKNLIIIFRCTSQPGLSGQLLWENPSHVFRSCRRQSL